MEEIVYGGRVRRLRPEDTFTLREVRGKVPLVICDPDLGPVVGYFDRGRQPPLGTTLAFAGKWVAIRIPVSLADIPPGFPIGPGVCRVEEQLEVTGWRRVSESFDWLLESFRSRGYQKKVAS